MSFAAGIRRYLLGGALADDNAGRHRVSRRDPWHDRSVGDAKMVDAVDPEAAVDDGPRVSSHLGRAGVVPEAHCGITQVPVQVVPLEIARHEFSGKNGRSPAELPTSRMP